MTITVACPSCSSSFPVDPAKIPPNGVRAQCSFCPEIFDVDVPGASEDPVAALPELDVAASVEPDVAETASESVGVDVSLDDVIIETNLIPEADDAASDEAESAALEVTDEMAPGEEPETAPVDELETASAESPETAPAEEPEASPGPIRFGRRTPEDKAKSLARSLVSDLVAYNSDKHREAMAAGTLEEVFQEKIQKSLKEYKEQVESEVVAKGSFFNDALNSILAEGQEMFQLGE